MPDAQSAKAEAVGRASEKTGLLTLCRAARISAGWPARQHSWSGPFGHFHHTRLLLRGSTSVGFKLPFFARCHRRARRGNSRASDRSELACWPAQKGQPVFKLVRELILASHTWSRPFGHFHQTFRREPAVTSLGRSSPFFVGCHWRTNDRYVDTARRGFRGAPSMGRGYSIWLAGRPLRDNW
jgi:hypothetical protein